jgi:hypothetical protein
LGTVVSCDETVSLPGVGRIGGIEGGTEDGVGIGFCLHPFDPAGALETPDPGIGQRAGQPVERRKRCAVVEVRWDLQDNWHVEVTSQDDPRIGTQWSADLNLDDTAVIG